MAKYGILFSTVAAITSLRRHNTLRTGTRSGYGVESTEEYREEHRKERQPGGARGSSRPAQLHEVRVSQIVIREGDSFEVALKRFSRKVQQDGVLSEAKRRRHYEPPSAKRKRQADARVRKARKRQAKLAARGY